MDGNSRPPSYVRASIKEAMRKNRDQPIFDMPGFNLLEERLVLRQFKTMHDLFSFADSSISAENLLFLARQDPQYGRYEYYAATIESFIKR